MVFIPIYSKETALYDTLAIKNDIDAAGNKADAYMTDVSGGGVMVHPKNDSSSGWRIASALELLKDGVSYIKAWLAGTSPNQVPTVQIGVDNGGHTTIDSNGMRVYGGDGTNRIANIGYGATETGDVTKYPYYTFGTRDPNEDVGVYSFTAGADNGANKASAAIGDSNKASGGFSFAVGHSSEAAASYSVAIGNGAQATQQNQIALGKFNDPTVGNGNGVFFVGNGSSDSSRSNLFAIYKSGTVEINGDPLFKLIKAHNLETTTMLPDSYTANDVKHEITSLVPDEYEVLNVTVSGTGYNSVNVYRLTWLWENNKLYIAYRLRRFSTVPETGNISVTPYVNIILINKCLL